MNAIDARLRTQEGIKNQFDFECRNLLQYIYIAAGEGKYRCHPLPTFNITDAHVKYLEELGYKVTKARKSDVFGFKEDAVKDVPFTINWE